MADTDGTRGKRDLRVRRGRQYADIAAVLVASSVRARKRSALLVALPSVALALIFAATPNAMADAASDLRSAVDGARGACPPLRADPTLDKLAERANYETQAYYTHTAQVIPFEDPMPELRELGYHAGKAKLVPSYADTSDKAVHGIVVAGFQAIPDCSYAKYGVNVLDHSDNGYLLAALLLVGE